MSIAQTFPLPTMPFHRDVNNGCPPGSIVKVTASPYADRNQNAQICLKTNNNDVALRIEFYFQPPTKIKIDCIVSQKTSSAIESLIRIPLESKFVLLIQSQQYAFQIYFNESKITDFVHRVDPTIIKKISIEGPLICEEVLLGPPSHLNLPSYEQITNSPPTSLFQNMTLEDNSKTPLHSTDLPSPPPGLTASESAPSKEQESNSQQLPPSSTSFFYTGNSQGFSAHPYPLPGLIDNNTYPSHPNPVGSIANVVTTDSTTTPIVSTATSSIPTSVTCEPRVTSSTPINNSYQPYTVTYPPTVPPTPAFPLPPQQQSYGPPQAIIPAPAAGGYYQNSNLTTQWRAPSGVAPIQQVIPSQTLVYPAASQYAPGYVQQPIYQYPNYYPGVVYYEPDHHHYFRYHHHHHHHCN